MIGDTIIKRLFAAGLRNDEIKQHILHLYTRKISVAKMARLTGVSKRLVIMMRDKIPPGIAIARIKKIKRPGQMACMTHNAADVGCHVPDSYTREVTYSYNIENGDILIHDVKDV